MIEKESIEIFTANEYSFIKKLYLAHREEFVNFSKKFTISSDTALDIYQDAFVALRKHAVSGKLNVISCSLKTYLFGIGKHLIFDELKRKKKYVPLFHKLDEDTGTIELVSIQKTEPLTIEQRLLRDNFKKLGKKCQHMLTLFFYRGLSNEEIFQKEGYENEAVVRSQKSRCLKALKEYIKKST